MKSCVILISGRGSNMQAILRANVPMRTAAVLSNDAAAAGLRIARDAGVPSAAIEHREFSERAAFDARLSAEIDRYQPDFVVLAGFMRILGPAFVQRYAGRLVNIHPSLLPAFPGLRTHRRALDAGVRIHGCTVHFVTAEVDHGPIIVQAAVPVLPHDDESSLAARVLEQEHRIYPQALAWLARGEVELGVSGRVSFPHARAAAPLIAPALES
ncbi:MAG: phosphoribosylglycinamide formyltransferase [Betaproteobacteria bacterium]|nr:MAG: phosphoribosylglycinamide formyltransferase [Betaproteobacteria bacterium]